MDIVKTFIALINGSTAPVGRGPTSPSRRSRRKKHNKKHTQRPTHSHRRRSQKQTQGKPGSPGPGQVIAFHGTPQAANAKSMFQHGFYAGNGNAYGDGIYLSTDRSVAKGYAGSAGVYLKCKVKLGKCACWNTNLQQRFQQWCRKRNVQADNSAKSAWLIQQGFHTLRPDNTTVIVLVPQYANPAAWKKKIHGLRILSVYNSANDRRIYV